MSLVCISLGNVACVRVEWIMFPSFNKQAFWKMDEEYKGSWKMVNLYAVCVSTFSWSTWSTLVSLLADEHRSPIAEGRHTVLNTEIRYPVLAHSWCEQECNAYFYFRQVLLQAGLAIFPRFVICWLKVNLYLHRNRCTKLFLHCVHHFMLHVPIFLHVEKYCFMKNDNAEPFPVCLRTHATIHKAPGSTSSISSVFFLKNLAGISLPDLGKPLPRGEDRAEYSYYINICLNVLRMFLYGELFTAWSGTGKE